MLTRAAAIVLAVCVLAFQPAVAQDLAPILDPGGSSEDASPQPKVSVVPAADDTAIADRLQRILDATGWFGAPRVRLQDGVAFLEGTAETQDNRRWATELAQNTEGVVAVVNNMQVVAEVGAAFERAGDEFQRFFRSAAEAWPIVVLAGVILAISLVLSWLVAVVARRILASRVQSPLLRSLLVRLIAVPVVLLGIYFVLQVAGLTRLALTVLGGTGVVGIVIGFAFRDIAENFLASILLSTRNPFRAGDLVEVAGQTGIVQNLNTRSTVLLTLDGNHVQIPNATVFKSTIKNFSSTATRRAEYLVGIGYDSSVAQAQAIIAAILKNHSAVLERPEPLVLVDELGASTVNLRVQYWFDSGTYSPAKINSALLRQTKSALLKAGIELPDASREVVFPKGVPLIRPQQGDAEPSGQSDAELRKGNADEERDTSGEGGLTAETDEIAQKSSGSVAEATENLLRN